MMGPYAKDFCARCLDAVLPRRKALAGLRAQWGQPGEKDEPLAARWFALTRGKVA